MTNHVALALVGFGAFVILALIAAFAQSQHHTRNESSYLAGRMMIARKIGLGMSERLNQHPTSLLVQKWVTFAAAAAALIFSIWHAIMAIVSK